MNKMEKQERKHWLNSVREMGGDAFSFRGEGITVVIVPCVGCNSDFVHVSIAQCDFKDDSFKLKRGQYIALERMLVKGETISVPYNGRDNLEVASDVLTMLVS